MLFSAMAWGAENSAGACYIDTGFNKTNRAKSLQLDKATRDIDRENIWLSQLPSLGISAANSVGNSETFEKLFRVKTLAPFAGLSVNIYSGGSLNLNLADNDADQKLLTLEKKSERNTYLMSLLNNIYALKNIQYTLRDIEQQIDYLNKNKRVYQFQVKKGERPAIELEIIETQINELQVNRETLKNDYQKSVNSMARQFLIPEQEIKNLSYPDISGCVHTSEIKINRQKLLVAKEKKDLELKKIDARLLPEVSLSAGVAATTDGESVNFSRGQYQVSLNASVNLSSVFQVNNDKRQAIIRLQQNELRYQDALIMYENDRENLLTSLKNLRLQLQTAQKSLALEQRRLEYVRTQYLNGKGTFISYMDETSRLLSEKNRLSQFENQRDYYETLYYFYN